MSVDRSEKTAKRCKCVVGGRDDTCYLTDTSDSSDGRWGETDDAFAAK
jgi:hypothetical protein